MQIEAFTTERLSPSRSLRGWQSYRLSARGLVIKPRGSEPFRASLRTYASQRYRFSEVSISPHVIASRPASSAVRPNSYMLSVINEGTVHVLQDGREAFAVAGDFIMVDTSRPLCVEATALKVKSIDISGTRMREVLPQVEGLTAICISGHTPGGM